MKRSIASSLFLALCVIGLGLVVLFKGIFGFDIGLGFWGIVGIAIAVLSVSSMINHGFNFGNVFFLLIGAWLIAGQFALLKANNFLIFIAILLIAIGIYVITSVFRNNKGSVKWTEVDDNGNPCDSDEYIKYDCSFGERNIVNDSKCFKGGKVDASFGTLRLDLSNIEIKGEARIEVSASFGEVEIFMPRNVPYKTSVSPFFGSFSNKAPYVPVVTGEPYIEITGSASFGTVRLR